MTNHGNNGNVFLCICGYPIHWPCEGQAFALTHGSRDKIPANLQATFSNLFSCVKFPVFRLEFYWNMFNYQALVQIMAWRRTGDKPLSEPMMAYLWTHICDNRPQSVNAGIYGPFFFRLMLHFLAATKQLYEWFSPSVRHTFLTMFPSSYHHEIFRSHSQWQKWRPCKRSRSEVKGQGHRV